MSWDGQNHPQWNQTPHRFHTTNPHHNSGYHTIPTGVQFSQPPTNRPTGVQFGQPTTNRPTGVQFGQPLTIRPPGVQFGQPTTIRPPGAQYSQPPTNRPTGVQYNQPTTIRSLGAQYSQPPTIRPTGVQYNQPPTIRPTGVQYNQPPTIRPTGVQYNQPPTNRPTGVQYNQPPTIRPTGVQYNQPPPARPLIPPPNNPNYSRGQHHPRDGRGLGGPGVTQRVGRGWGPGGTEPGYRWDHWGSPTRDTGGQGFHHQQQGPGQDWGGWNQQQWPGNHGNMQQFSRGGHPRPGQPRGCRGARIAWVDPAVSMQGAPVRPNQRHATDSPRKYRGHHYLRGARGARVSPNNNTYLPSPLFPGQTRQNVPQGREGSGGGGPSPPRPLIPGRGRGPALGSPARGPPPRQPPPGSPAWGPRGRGASPVRPSATPRPLLDNSAARSPGRSPVKPAPKTKVFIPIPRPQPHPTSSVASPLKCVQPGAGKPNSGKPGEGSTPGSPRMAPGSPEKARIVSPGRTLVVSAVSPGRSPMGSPGRSPMGSPVSSPRSPVRRPLPRNPAAPPYSRSPSKSPRRGLDPDDIQDVHMEDVDLDEPIRSPSLRESVRKKAPEYKEISSGDEEAGSGEDSASTSSRSYGSGVSSGDEDDEEEPQPLRVSPKKEEPNIVPVSQIQAVAADIVAVVWKGSPGQQTPGPGTSPPVIIRTTAPGTSTIRTTAPGISIIRTSTPGTNIIRTIAPATRTPAPGISIIRTIAPGTSTVRTPTPGSTTIRTIAPGTRTPAPATSTIRTPTPGVSIIRTSTPATSRNPAPGVSIIRTIAPGTRTPAPATSTIRTPTPGVSIIKTSTPATSRNPAPGVSIIRTIAPGTVRTPVPGASTVRTPVPGTSTVRAPVPGTSTVRTPAPGVTPQKPPLRIVCVENEIIISDDEQGDSEEGEIDYKPEEGEVEYNPAESREVEYGEIIDDDSVTGDNPGGNPSNPGRARLVGDDDIIEAVLSSENPPISQSDDKAEFTEIVGVLDYTTPNANFTTARRESGEVEYTTEAGEVDYMSDTTVIDLTQRVHDLTADSPDGSRASSPSIEIVSVSQPSSQTPASPGRAPAKSALPQSPAGSPRGRSPRKPMSPVGSPLKSQASPPAARLRGGSPVRSPQRTQAQSPGRSQVQSPVRSPLGSSQLGRLSLRNTSTPQASQRSALQSSQSSARIADFDDSFRIDVRAEITYSDDDEDELPGAASIIRGSRRVPSSQNSQSNISNVSMGSPNTRRRQATLVESIDEDSAAAKSGEHEENYNRLQGHLDRLLAERTREEKVNTDMAEIQRELKQGLQSGGINRYAANESEDDLMPEHRETLKELSVTEREILDHPPGEQVFHMAHAQCLFTSSLSLRDLGFSAGESYIDRHLSTSTPDQVMEMVVDEVLTLCFDNISSPGVILKWIFHSMSVCANSRAVHACYKALYDVLHKVDGAGSTWVPRPVDIARVLVNFGAKVSEICSPSEFGHFDMEDLIFDHGNDKNGAVNIRPGELDCFMDQFVENIKFVTQTVTNAIINRPDQYSRNDLILICLMIFRTVLAKELIQDCIKVDHHTFFAAALNAFPEDQWPFVRQKLCVLVPQMTDNHHNRVQLVQVLPLVERGHQLQRRLAFAMLLKIMYPDTDKEVNDNLKIHDLVKLLNKISLKNKENYNFYQLASIIKLTDLCVGNEPLKMEEKEDLKSLSAIVSKLMGDVKELPRFQDRTMVKDIMVRLTSKWSFMIHSMGSVQTTLFGYASGGRLSNRIEQISPEDEFEESDRDASDREEDMDTSTHDVTEDMDTTTSDAGREGALEEASVPDLEPVLDPTLGAGGDNAARVKDDDDDMNVIQRSLAADHGDGDSDSSDLPEL